ncbi:MAG TPA: hypothetical protein VNX68_04800, partial [Nitrosopumilaceae archaeon]|nr:hypothetical protein [Nitrosopumilaceae archaeon]
SDILIYCNVSNLFPKYNDYTFTISKKLGPQCCYFPGSDKLGSFCDFIVKLYAEPEYMERLEKKYQYHLTNKLPGGVCDMTAFWEYQKDYPNCAKDLNNIEEGQVFDDNINEGDGFEMEDGKIKRIEMKNGFPFGTLTGTGKQIKFNTLHFQGVAKKYIYRYYTGKGLHGLKRKLSVDVYLSRHNLLVRIAKRLGYKFT